MSRAYHWVAEVHKAMRTVIGDGLKQQLQAPQEVPHDIASLVAQRRSPCARSSFEAQRQGTSFKIWLTIPTANRIAQPWKRHGESRPHAAGKGAPTLALGVRASAPGFSGEPISTPPSPRTR